MIPPQKRAHLISLLYQAHSSSKLLATREPAPLSFPRFSSRAVLLNCLTAGEPYIAYGMTPLQLGKQPRNDEVSQVLFRLSRWGKLEYAKKI